MRSRKFISLVFLAVILCLLAACAAKDAAPSQAAAPLPGRQAAPQELAIRIVAGDKEMAGVLYDSEAARQFAAQLPQTVAMSNYGGREVYGSIKKKIKVEGEGQLRFNDGDITYCPANNTVAIFYSQSDKPNLTMRVYPIGRVISDLDVFPKLPSRVEIIFSPKK